MMFLFVHSKSKASPIASRMRGSLNIGRRKLKYQPCDPAGTVVRQRLLLDPAFADRREVVARRPDARGEFLLEIDLAGLEGLEGHLPVAVIFEADVVEIIDADIHRQILAPIIGDAIELDEAAGSKRPTL